MDTENLDRLSDDEIRARLKRLAEAERRLTYAMVCHLAEYDARKLYIPDGVGTLWHYCTRVLRLSEDQAALRVRVANAVRDNPELKAALARGELSASAIRKIAPHVESGARTDLLEQAKGKTLAEVERLVAGARVEKEMSQARVQASLDEEARPSLFPGSDECKPTPAACSAYVRDRERDSIVPVSATDFRVSFVADAAFVKTVQEVQNLLAAKFPEARLEDVLGAVCRLFLEKEDPARRAKRRRERTAALAGETKPAARPKIPAAVRDRVLERHGNQCAFVGPEGRCPERRRLELDHIVPKARGGADTEGNLRPMCRRHNGFMAILAFGAAYVEEAIRRRQETSRGPPAA